MSIEHVDPWIDCERCGRRSPPDFDTYEDVIMHNCEADEWIGMELENGRVRGPYLSHEGPWPPEEERWERAGELLEKFEDLTARGGTPDPSTFFGRPPTRQLSEEEMSQFAHYVRTRFDGPRPPGLLTRLPKQTPASSARPLLPPTSRVA